MYRFFTCGTVLYYSNFWHYFLFWCRCSYVNRSWYCKLLAEYKLNGIYMLHRPIVIFIEQGIHQQEICVSWQGAASSSRLIYSPTVVFIQEAPTTKGHKLIFDIPRGENMNLSFNFDSIHWQIFRFPYCGNMFE